MSDQKVTPVDHMRRGTQAVSKTLLGLLEADFEKRLGNNWRLIETAPLDVNVLLGWWEEWPHRVWRQEVGIAGHENSYKGMNIGVSDGWLHGSATHWQPLPAPPGA